MVFSGIPFLFYFLPVFLIVYWIVPGKLKNLALLLGSLFFYAWGEPRFVLLMAAEILGTYLCGLLIERFRGRRGGKLALAAGIVLMFGVLAYYKYADFFIENMNRLTGLDMKFLKLALPIGISFYTFQMASYLVDVCRGTVKAQRNPVNLGAYIAMFPQLIAGPIVRYKDIEAELSDRHVSAEELAEGIKRFCVGLGKKVILANSLGEIVSLYEGNAERTVLLAWIYVAAVSLQIYFDFSGYSDMAIGLGRILGFHFSENFTHPFESKSATEFWRRWHMTRGTWFRDYLYIPMGGNRVSAGRHIFNILVVWFATGLWHGASWNFVLWGLFFAVFLLAEKYIYGRKLEKVPVLGHIYLIALVLVSFLLFHRTDLQGFGDVMCRLFGGRGAALTDDRSLYILRSCGVLLIVSCIGAVSLPARAVKKLRTVRGGELLLSAAELVFVLGTLVVCTAYLVSGSYNPFLYFRF